MDGKHSEANNNVHGVNIDSMFDAKTCDVFPRPFSGLFIDEMSEPCVNKALLFQPSDDPT
jgi:hypothetical protein